MKIEVTEYEKIFSFELDTVAQLCGQNIIKKSYILESLRRYFGTYKYREEQNKWRDNVKINHETVGRRFFTLISISRKTDILDMIKWSKQSLLAEYISQFIQKYRCQSHLTMINKELENIYQALNMELNQLGSIELTYSVSSVWDMVQKTSVIGRGDTSLEDKENYELLLTWINLLESVLANDPKKMLIIMEDIDHIVSRDEYKDFLVRIQNICTKYDIYFVLSTSIDGYVVCDKELCSGISIYGDVDFQMPTFDKVMQYIINNYPYYKAFTEYELQQNLAKIIHRIGQKSFLSSIEENVVCKLINKSLMLNEKWKNNENIAEIAFLKS